MNQHVPTPAIVHASDDLGVRLWYCRACGVEQHRDRLPNGWYSIGRHFDGPRIARLGLYCSLECIETQMPRLRGIAEAVTEADRQSPYQQQPSLRPNVLAWKRGEEA